MFCLIPNWASVTKLKALDSEQMDVAVESFIKEVNMSPGIAFFYFVWHGFQLEGAQYSVPERMDRKDAEERLLRKTAFELDARFAQKVKKAASIIVIDACRVDGLFERF